MSFYPTAAPEELSLSFSALDKESTLSAGVDFWLLDLSLITEADSTNLARHLHEDDVTRAQQFKKNRLHFLATRALLRKALSRYTAMAAQDLQFARTNDGKPFLANAAQPLYFNLTHSGNFAALAVSRAGEVGIDIESPRKRSYLKIVEHYFHPDEVQALHECAEAKREQLFYRLWTLKEAFFKALGTGISTGLDKAAFAFDREKIHATFAPELKQQTAEWQFHQQFITPTTVVALALHSAQALQYRWLYGNALLTSN